MSSQCACTRRPTNFSLRNGAYPNRPVNSASDAGLEVVIAIVACDATWARHHSSARFTRTACPCACPSPPHVGSLHPPAFEPGRPTRCPCMCLPCCCRCLLHPRVSPLPSSPPPAPAPPPLACTRWLPGATRAENAVHLSRAQPSRSPLLHRGYILPAAPRSPARPAAAF
ncbi:hypothetical protein PVAP13_5KG196800 [Panicum virgatum]|uniref:Uncharacterized protein n=1 Tax=Panicum virgatum TaxID=38727 RepID=A0A8T0SJ18_PANVG|nr:hypothetical protein PVAP13_5KG196800 [Panicum virgatum]